MYERPRVKVKVELSRSSLEFQTSHVLRALASGSPMLISRGGGSRNSVGVL